jgi:hypothetical protein
MTSAGLSRRVGKVVGYPPLSEMTAGQRCDFHEALVEADSFGDLPGKWKAAIINAEGSRPNLRVLDTEPPLQTDCYARLECAAFVRPRTVDSGAAHARIRPLAGARGEISYRARFRASTSRYS